MNKLLATALLGLSLFSANVLAHGSAKAQHGGIVKEANDLSFELVSQPAGAAIFVVDHDAPADVSKMSGKLTVLNGTQKSEADLKPTGPDKLEATGVKVVAGSKVVATIHGAVSKALTVRFTVK